MNPSPQFDKIPTNAPNPNAKIGRLLRPGLNTKESVGRMGPTRLPNSFNKSSGKNK